MRPPKRSADPRLGPGQGGHAGAKTMAARATAVKGQAPLGPARPEGGARTNRTNRSGLHHCPPLTAGRDLLLASLPQPRPHGSGIGGGTSECSIPQRRTTSLPLLDMRRNGGTPGLRLDNEGVVPFPANAGEALVASTVNGAARAVCADPSDRLLTDDSTQTSGHCYDLDVGSAKSVGEGSTWLREGCCHEQAQSIT